VTRTDALRLHADDNVVVALRDIAPGERLVWQQAGTQGAVLALGAVPLGHKISLALLHPGDAVLKYGSVIGRATSEVPAGAHVQVHNLASARAKGRP
jgi:altronate dehydratase